MKSNPSGLAACTGRIKFPIIFWQLIEYNTTTNRLLWFAPGDSPSLRLATTFATVSQNSLLVVLTSRELPVTHCRLNMN